MLSIGLTGGIAAGKSTVSDLFTQYGIPVIDADVIAHQLTQADPVIRNALQQHFAEHNIIKQGTLDRRALRTLIFKEPAHRTWLEALLHPRIKSEIQNQIASIFAVPYVIAAIPLLYDRDAFPFLNRILVVDATREMQICRLCARDNMHKEEALRMIDSQISREQRLAMADDIIINSDTIKEVEQQVQALHLRYLELASR